MYVSLLLIGGMFFICKQGDALDMVRLSFKYQRSTQTPFHLDFLFLCRAAKLRAEHEKHHLIIDVHNKLKCLFHLID